MSAGVVQPGSDPQKKIAALAATAMAAKKVSGEPESAFSRRRIKAPEKAPDNVE